MFLEINGYIMRIDMEIVDMALKITMNQVTFESFVEWVRNRTIHQ